MCDCSLRRNRRDNGKETILKEMRVMNFPTLMKTMYLQTKEARRNLKKD